jgi:hypothetical protein
MVVLHNPQARIKLRPEMIPGASHEFLLPDGRTISLVPEFHPMFSITKLHFRYGTVVIAMACPVWSPQDTRPVGAGRLRPSAADGAEKLVDPASIRNLLKCPSTVLPTSILDRSNGTAAPWASHLE